MGAPNYNLQIHLAKADNSQAFQNQYLLLDRALVGEALGRGVASHRVDQEQVQTLQESEGREIEPDRGRARVLQRPRRARPRTVPREEARPPRAREPGPNGEGTLIDIVV